MDIFLLHCLIFVGSEHQASKIYQYLTKRHIKSNQHMDSPNPFRNYVKTTLNHGLNLSEADLGDLKRETTKHGPTLMEVDWGGKIEPSYTSSGCILIQVDWGSKLRVNHINECMPSDIDMGAHETDQNGHSITKVDWGCHASHIQWENLQAYNIEGTVQQENEHKNQGACQAVGIV